MANTYVDYTATAGQTDFAFSFDYLEDEHVEVYIDGTKKTLTTDYTIVTSPSTKIVLTVAATGDESVRIRRNSDPSTDLVDFVNGSVLTETELDRAYQHNRYLNEEAFEGNQSSLQTVEGGTDFDANFNKIVNLGTPTNSTDAAHKNYVDTLVSLEGTSLSGFNKSVHVGNAVDTVFTLSFTAQTATAAAFIVTLDGVVQVPDTDYTIETSTNQITFTSIVPLGVDIVVVPLGTAADVNSVGVTATGSTAARSLADRFGEVVNVLDYIPSSLHADIKAGTSTTNVASYFSTALGGYSATTSLYIPSGTYYLGDSVLSLGINKKLYGESRQTTVLQWEFDSQNSAIVYDQYCHLENFRMINSGTDHDTTAALASYTPTVDNGGSNSIIRNIWIGGSLFGTGNANCWGYGLTATDQSSSPYSITLSRSQTYNSLIDYVFFVGCGRYGVYLGVGANQLKFQNCFFRRHQSSTNTDAEVKLNNALGVEFSQCLFEGSTVPLDFSMDLCQNIAIKDCYFEPAKGIYANTCPGLIVDGNVLNGISGISGITSNAFLRCNDTAGSSTYDRPIYSTLKNNVNRNVTDPTGTYYWVRNDQSKLITYVSANVGDNDTSSNDTIMKYSTGAYESDAVRELPKTGDGGSDIEASWCGFDGFNHTDTGLTLDARTSITDATNASPIVITATGHGLTTGNKISIRDVLGNTAANVTNHAVTVIDANSFSLDGTTGDGAYTSGGEVYSNTVIKSNFATLTEDTDLNLGNYRDQGLLFVQVFNNISNTSSIWTYSVGTGTAGTDVTTNVSRISGENTTDQFYRLGIDADGNLVFMNTHLSTTVTSLFIQGFYFGRHKL